MRRGEKERQSLSLLLGKATQGGGENPTKEAAEKNLVFFSELLSLNKREKGVDCSKRESSSSNLCSH
jgi:hypothetical protein